MVWPFHKKTKSTGKRPKRISGRWAVLQIWLRRFGVGLAVIVLVLWGAAWLWLSGSVSRAITWSQNQTLAFTQDIGFSVGNIMVEGRVNTNPDVLLALINTTEGDPLFAFDPASAREQIERISWIKSTRVERRFPDTIYISLSEREPLALYHNGEKLVLLDQEGEAITDNDLDRFKDLILLSGKGADDKAPALMTNLRAEPALLPLVESASYISERRWDLKLHNGIRVELPEEDMPFALRRLSRAHEEDALLDKKVKAIDMRLTDRIIIRTYPGEVQDYKVNYNAAASNSSSPI